MNKTPIIIDCDTGLDDAAALILAAASDRFELLGVTTVSGNVGLEHTTPNTLKVLNLIDCPAKVYPGADRPMFCEQFTAVEVHGTDGLRGIQLPETTRQAESTAAWDFIYSEAVKHNGELEIIAIGPLTNLGILLSKYGNMSSLIKRIVIMGGASIHGNTTPSAEFNIYADPEAAEMVFHSGIPIYVCALDVTHKSTVRPEEIAVIRAMGSPKHTLFADVCEHSWQFSKRHYSDIDGAPMHDPCAVLFALDDSYFTTKACWVGVETKGTITRGRTVTDLYSDAKNSANAVWVTDINRDKFIATIYDLLK